MDKIEECYNKIEGWREELKKIYEKSDRGDDFERENLLNLKPMLKKICELFVTRYEIYGPFSLGGSAIVFKIHEKFSDTDRILKFSRPLRTEEQIAKAIKEEGRSLRFLKHPNIIDLFEAGAVEYMAGSNIGYTITEFAEGGDWEKKVESDIESLQSPDLVLNNVLLILYDTVKGLEYIHQNEFVHMDIKPSNVLLTGNGIAKIADMGFAKYLDEKLSEKNTIVGFTKPYAHPDVLNYKKSESSKNRATAELQYKYFRKTWDIYALGQSILEILSKIDKKFQDDAKHLSLFGYLHLMACRMLDGHNSEKGRFFNELASGLFRSALEEIKYERVTEIRLDIEKELGIFTLDKAIPELNIFSRDTIHGSEWKPTILTPRLRDLLYHPLVSRLSRVSQLGLVRFLYPTASHSRFDHLLGTFSNTCAYIDALYHDENPIFKQILRKEDLQAIMLTSLLHDLGQYPLAHDLEDLDKDFQHSKYSIELLNDVTQDDKGRTLKNIISSEDCWNTSIKQIESIIKASEIKDFSSVIDQPKFRDKLLSTIISGPIDSDKTDYLMRDTRECRLYYGYAIDFDRLMQTITIDYNNENNSFQLAIYHKGRACAESISLTRYLMFASAYWHHTSRAYKTMLQYSIKLLLGNLNNDLAKKKFWKDFHNFIITLNYTPQKIDLRKEIKNKGPHQNITETDLSILCFFYERTTVESKRLLKMLASRELYKRLASLDYSSERKGRESPWDLFQKISSDWGRKLELSQNLQKRFKIEVRRRSKDSGSATLSDEKMEKFDELMEVSNLTILVDIPPVKDIEQPLKFKKEMMEDRYLDIPSEKMSQLSEAWMGTIEDLFKSICTVRIFCHPEVRNQIRAALTYDQIEIMAREELGKIN